jgi:DNA-binding transcriptional ArsR family regulator
MAARQRAASAGGARAAPPAAQQELFALTDLEQVKVLADPLRLRILQALCEERTTKQVADLLGEKPTRLYHHVAALARVGLVRLTRRQPKRGTVEKYYQAVARAFQTDRSLLAAPAGEAGQALRPVLGTLLTQTAAELEALAAHAAALEAGAVEEEVVEEAVVSFLELRAGAAEIRRVRAALKRLLRGLQASGPARPRAAVRRYRLTIAFFPLDRSGEP